MNNFENMKQMTVDEMAEFMTKNVHKVGKFYRQDLPRLDVLVFADGPYGTSIKIQFEPAATFLEIIEANI